MPLNTPISDASCQGADLAEDQLAPPRSRLALSHRRRTRQASSPTGHLKLRIQLMQCRSVRLYGVASSFVVLRPAQIAFMSPYRFRLQKGHSPRRTLHR